MCLIIDINIAHKVFLVEDDPEFGDIHRIFFETGFSQVKMVYSQQLLDEYKKNRDVLRLVTVFDRQGRTREVSSELVAADMEVLSQSKLCHTNDLHILAIARVGGVRLVVTNDAALARDFSSKSIIDNPGGNAYDHPRHNDLLRIHCGVQMKAKPKQPRTPKKR